MSAVQIEKTYSMPILESEVALACAAVGAYGSYATLTL